MNLHRALTQLYPAAPRGSWDVNDDGYGPYIAEWRLVAPRPDAGPTLDELLAAKVAFGLADQACSAVDKADAVASQQALAAYDAAHARVQAARIGLAGHTATLAIFTDAWAAFQANAPKRAARAALQASDARMARVAEDIVDLLKAKGLIADADLPVSVRALVAERKAARAQFGGGGQ